MVTFSVKRRLQNVAEMGQMYTAFFNKIKIGIDGKLLWL